MPGGRDGKENGGPGRGDLPRQAELIRSGRRTLAMEIAPDGHLRIRAPFRMSGTRIADFVRAKEPWILKTTERVLARNEAHPEPTPEEAARLREEAARVLPEKTARYARLMGVCPAAVTITGARTRFGSCSSGNRISFSWRLMRYPEAAVDYVVVHELAHIRHHDHSPPFYALVASVLPDWRERRALLRK